MKRRPLRPSLRELTRVTPLRRRKRLESASRLRRSPLSPVNPERLKRLRKLQFDAHADRVRTLPCLLCCAPPRSDAAHVVSRGAGGRWWHLVPNCRRCHIGWHADRERSLPEGWTRERLLVEAAHLAWESHDMGLAPAPGIPRPTGGAT